MNMELCDSDVKYDRFCNVPCGEGIFLCWMWNNSKSRVKNEALTTTVTVAYCLWCMLRILLVKCLCKNKKKVPQNIPTEPVTCKYTKISQSRCHENEKDYLIHQHNKISHSCNKVMAISNNFLHLYSLYKHPTHNSYDSLSISSVKWHCGMLMRRLPLWRFHNHFCAV